MSIKLALSLSILLTLSSTAQATHKHRRKIPIATKLRLLESQAQAYGEYVNSLEKPRAQLNLFARTFPPSHPAYAAANRAHEAIIALQTSFQIMQTEIIKSQYRLIYPSQISEKAARAAQLAEQEAERYFIAGLAARKAQRRKLSQQEVEILKVYRAK
jgi:hypothetical protein